jgi:hypothetical protein
MLLLSCPVAAGASGQGHDSTALAANSAEHVKVSMKGSQAGEEW